MNIYVEGNGAYQKKKIIYIRDDDVDDDDVSKGGLHAAYLMSGSSTNTPSSCIQQHDTRVRF